MSNAPALATTAPMKQPTDRGTQPRTEANTKPRAEPNAKPETEPVLADDCHKLVDDATYESPLKKLKKSMDKYPLRTVTTIDAIRAFTISNDVANPDLLASVRIRARLLWKHNDTVHGTHHNGHPTVLRFLRLHLGEEQAPEPFAQQQKEFMEAHEKDAARTNQYLITTSLYDIELTDPRLPAPGSVVMFTPTKLRVYRNCVQVDTKIHSITAVNTHITM